MKKLFIATIALAFYTATALAAGPTLIRLEVWAQEPGESPTTVKMNLPIRMLEAMRPTINEALADIHFEKEEFDLIAIWREVRDYGPHEYLQVKDGNHNINVATTETHLLITGVSDEQGDIEVTIPLTLMDMLVDTQSGELDFDAFLADLAFYQDQDLLTITGDNLSVRAWVE